MALESGNYEVTGYVKRDRSQYVHERSTDVCLEVNEYELEVANAVVLGKLVDKLEEEMGAHIVRLNKQIYRELEQEYEYLTSDLTILESLDAGGMHFEADGEYVDMREFRGVEALPEPVKQKVIQRYVDLFDRTPEQVEQTLTLRDLKFDEHGNQIDLSEFKLASELPENIQKKVLEEYRDWTTDHDWWDYIYENWIEKLGGLGFNDVEISFSGFWSQGDGASFTAKSIDVAKYIRASVKLQAITNKARAVTDSLLSACV